MCFDMKVAIGPRGRSLALNWDLHQGEVYRPRDWPTLETERRFVEELRLASRVIRHQIPHIKTGSGRIQNQVKSGRVLRSGKYNNAGPYHQC